MTTIERSRWPAFADRFTKEHDGWGASVELRQIDGGIEVAVDDQPFRGLTVEERSGRQSLILAFGDDPDEHVAHIVEQPGELSVLETGSRKCSLVIGLADGTGCVLELTNPFTTD